MSKAERLFAGPQTLDAYLNSRREQIPAIVMRLEDQVLTDTADNDLISRILQNVEVDHIELQSDQGTLSRSASTKDISHELGRLSPIEKHGPQLVPATILAYVIDFSGPADLFKLKINSTFRNLPHGRVEGGQVIISQLVANDRLENASDEFMREQEQILKDQKKLLKACVAEANRMIDDHNRCCANEARDAVEAEISSRSEAKKMQENLRGE